MNKQPLVSVVVPVYNVERYVDECVASIAKQTYRNLEIILVDDGSTDGSSAICDEWASRDDRIRVIHNTNGGVSAARNTGMNAAEGEYLAFVDSDDLIEPNMIEVLLHKAYRSSCQMVMCGTRNVCRSVSGYVVVGANRMAFPATNTRDQLSMHIASLLRNGYFVPVWNTLYEHAFVRRCRVRFDETLRIGEDGQFKAQLYRYAERVECLPFLLYNYVVRGGFQSGRSVGEYRYRNWKRVCMTMIALMKDYGSEVVAVISRGFIYEIGVMLADLYVPKALDKGIRRNLVRDIAADDFVRRCAHTAERTGVRDRIACRVLGSRNWRALAIYGRTVACLKIVSHTFKSCSMSGVRAQESRRP
ncbi:glycosyltransferase family 2 protein [Bifidobacterium scaligerum]|uniref:Glycosyltransferase 2-like domain-containing protein n=1 Tax=Bifidobacterium scaligerum TaxID=2052656 RepID=A0A2M9HS69_9BIFI|nr:glycosyltransferase [Bifidobacterium scaligerum]PJM79666.1 hypothetical protein CUU80_00470 [Bifidobacterium scaligerum]